MKTTKRLSVQLLGQARRSCPAPPCPVSSLAVHLHFQSLSRGGR